MRGLPSNTANVGSLAKVNRRTQKYKVAAKAERTRDGVTYASKGEMMLAEHIALEVRSGLWNEVYRQPSVSLGPIDWRVDFATCNGERCVWWEFKGREMPDYRIKRKLWESFGPGELRVVKASGKTIKTVEVVQGGRRTQKPARGWPVPRPCGRSDDGEVHNEAG